MFNKKWVLLFCILISFNAFAGAHIGRIPQFLDIVRDTVGSVAYMTQGAAIRYCASHGNHLPSARELAQLAKNLGAKGIVDECAPGLDCYYLQPINANGRQDSFSFSPSGYQRPSGDLGNNAFWSSSSAYIHPYGYPIFFEGSGGNIVNGNRDKNGVRCVSGR